MALKTALLLFLSVFTLVIVAGCSLEVPHSDARNLNVRLIETPDLLTQVSGSMGILAAPASTSTINCFFLNVTGTGIVSEDRFPPNCAQVDNMHGRGVGKGSPPTARGLPLQADVPAGPARRIDVYGLFPDIGIPGCPNSGGESSGVRVAYFLGGVSLDLNENRVIDIPITITSSTPESVRCLPGTGGGSNASAFALGQPDLTSGTANNGGRSAQTLSAANGVHSDGSKLFVADASNNRVLIWNSIPGATQVSANVVLGQSNFTGGTSNFGGLGASSLSAPGGVFSDGTKLFVADTGNNRVLIWNTIPATNNTAADVVVGQTNFTGAGTSTAAAGMNGPSAVWVVGTKLIVTDKGNSRVTIFNTIPAANGIAANIAVGQSNLATGTANTGGISASRLNNPSAATSNGTKLFIADMLNHRVLIFNTIPVATNTAADNVLGQANFTSSTTGTTSTTMNTPTGVLAGSAKLVVSEAVNNRVLIFDTIPTVDQTAANFAIGQPNLTSGAANNGGLSSQSLSGPVGLSSTSSHLLISDSGNSRILAFPMNGF